MASVKREKIAILGGGVGALTAAYQLTKVPNWQDQFEITIYQAGWRLGGKGASARNVDRDWRIEEHGPHVWFGFYFNAFHNIDDAYRYCVENDLLPQGSFTNWEQAFEPKDSAVVLEYVQSRWHSWLLTLPRRPGTPVKPVETDFWSLIDEGLEMLMAHQRRVETAIPVPLQLHAERGLLSRLFIATHRLMARIGGQKSAFETLEPGEFLKWASALARIEATKVKSGAAPFSGRFGLYILNYLLGRLAALIRNAVLELEGIDDIRHAWQMLDMGIAIFRGMLADGVLTNGFDAIEDFDFSRWLGKHGCHDPWSSLIRSIYDSGAHYEGGITGPASDPNRRPVTANLAAGTAVHCLLRMFAGYSRIVFLPHKAGMGETVVTPIYLALRHRGVKFAFFNRVKKLRLNASKDAVEGVDLDIQATVSAGPFSYQPLLPPFRGLLCWPNHPLFSQLAEGADLENSGSDLESAWCDFHVGTRTLKAGSDFHRIVLGITIAGLPPICEQLSDASSRWRDMLDKIKTVQTQFFQVWLNCPTERLLESATVRPTAEGFVEPIDTWLDMSRCYPRRDGPPPKGAFITLWGPFRTRPDLRSGNQAIFHSNSARGLTIISSCSLKRRF